MNEQSTGLGQQQEPNPVPSAAFSGGDELVHLTSQASVTEEPAPATNGIFWNEQSEFETDLLRSKV